MRIDITIKYIYEGKIYIDSSYNVFDISNSFYSILYPYQPCQMKNIVFDNNGNYNNIKFINNYNNNNSRTN